MDHSWAVLFGAFVAPFVQEDAAVFGAAGAAVAGLAPPWAVLSVALVGLVVSDTWKYWAGRVAGRHAWARRMAEKPVALAARDRIVNHLAASMFAARFVPGTRVPLYVAAGLFRAPFAQFFAYVVASGALYLGLAYGILRAFGAVAGERAAATLPLVIAGIALAYFAALGIRSWLRRRRRIASEGLSAAETTP